MMFYAVRRPSLGALLAGFTISAWTSQAQNAPEEVLPGFKSSTVYDSSGVDNVNAFSGALSTTVKLGPTYQLGGGATFSLTAVYNSKLWSFYTDQTCPQPEPQVYASKATITGFPTLGAGWSLQPGGYIVPTYKFLTYGTGLAYVGPDGGAHEATGSFPTYFTNDGSRLRIDQNVSIPGLSSPNYVVSFPDGIRYGYSHQFRRPMATTGSSPDFYDDNASPSTYYFGLTKIYDRYDNEVAAVTYAPADQDDRDNVDAWRFTSIALSGNRTIGFFWGTSTSGTVTWPVLTRIDLPTVSADGVNPRTEYVTFDRTAGNFLRNEYAEAISCGFPDHVYVPLLTGINLGDLNSPLTTYTFGYRNDPAILSVDAGVMTSLTLPTGGVVSYTYAATVDHDWTGGCSDASTSPLPSDPDAVDPFPHYQRFMDRSAAVVGRTETDPFTGLVSSTTYARKNCAKSVNGTITPGTIARRVIVTSPAGNLTATGSNRSMETRYVFHFDPDPPYYTSGIELERRVFDPDSPTSVLRTTVNCYQGDFSSTTACGYKSGLDANGAILTSSYTQLGNNVRRSRSVVWYGSNPLDASHGGELCSTSYTTPCWQSDLTGFNASAGEYGTETIKSNKTQLLPFTSRVITTTWTPNTSRWLLKLFSQKTVNDYGACTSPCAARTDFTFNSNNGFLDLVKTVNPGSPSSYLSTTYTDDGYGNPQTEVIDGTGVSRTYQRTRTFSLGQVSTTKWDNLTPSWYSFNVTRDTGTGQILKSKDPNNLETAFGYDTLGRITSVTLPGENPTTVCYNTPWLSNPAYVVVKKGVGATNACIVNDGTPDAGTILAFQYDGFGRTIREVRRLPNKVPASTGSYFSVRQTEYDPAGHASFVSEWVPCNATPSASDLTRCFSTNAVDANRADGTASYGFDAFGRPTTVRKADGKTTTISYTDPDLTISSSDSFESVTIDVAGTSVTTKTRKDLFGRITSVEEPSVGGTTADNTTTYKYNVFDKLASVSQQSGTTVQTRSFTYDGRGLMTAESHPEKGTSSYTSFDALRNVAAKTEGAGISYTYGYDAAARLTQVNAGGVSYLEYTYDTNQYPLTCSGQKPLGRATKQVSHNSAANGDVIDFLCYGDSAGRLTGKTTQVSGGTNVEQTWSYNGMGLPLIHRHEAISGVSSDYFFQTETAYTSGLPTSIDARHGKYGGSTLDHVITAATYGASGVLASYTAANGVTTTIAQDGLLPRPKRISTTGATQGFDTGDYGYDGAGNILSMAAAAGTETFSYDTRSRLTGWSYPVSGQPTRSETFTFDRFGNLTNTDVYSNGAFQFATASSSSLTNNRLNGSGTTYNALGNLTRAGISGVGYVLYGFDSLSRQTTHQVEGSTPIEKYSYDAAGERTIRSIPTSQVEANPNPAAASPSMRFYTLTPCRLYDSRDAGNVPLYALAETIVVARGKCGIPNEATQLSANLTTTGPTSNGSARAYPSAVAIRPLGPANSFLTGSTRAMQLFVGLSAQEGSFTLYGDMPAGNLTHVIVDVSGYWAPTSPPASDVRSSYYTFRDAGNRASREYRLDASEQSQRPFTPDAILLIAVERDSVYLGNLLVGTLGQYLGWRYYSSDHLGTPRLVTSPYGQTLFQPKTRPFGLPLTTLNPSTRTSFAAMERDPFSGNHYDHARFYTGWTGGRFLSPDKLSGEPEDPQTWNRYSYVLGNPIRYIDPEGLAEIDAGTSQSAAADEYCRRVGVGCRRDSVKASVTVTAKGPSDFEVQAKKFLDRVLMSTVEPFANLSMGVSQRPFRDAFWVAAAVAGGALNAGSSAKQTTTLYRAVSAAELDDILATGRFRLIPGIETKYFSTSLPGAAKEAKMLFRLTRGSEGAYTIVKTKIAAGAITSDMMLTVDAGVETVVLEGSHLGSLGAPTALKFSPIPR